MTSSSQAWKRPKSPSAGARSLISHLQPGQKIVPASSSRVPSRTSMLIASIRRRRIARPASFATRPSPWTASTPVRITPNFCGASASRTPHQQLLASGRHHLRALQKPLAGGTLLQVDQAASSDQAVLRHVGERGEDADLDCRLGLRPRRHRQEASRPGRSLYTLLQILSVTLFEKMPIHQARGETKTDERFANNQPIEFIRFLTRTLVYSSNERRAARGRCTQFCVPYRRGGTLKLQPTTALLPRWPSMGRRSPFHKTRKVVDNGALRNLQDRIRALTSSIRTRPSTTRAA